MAREQVSGQVAATLIASFVLTGVGFALRLSMTYPNMALLVIGLGVLLLAFGLLAWRHPRPWKDRTFLVSVGLLVTSAFWIGLTVSVYLPDLVRTDSPIAIPSPSTTPSPPLSPSPTPSATGTRPDSSPSSRFDRAGHTVYAEALAYGECALVAGIRSDEPLPDEVEITECDQRHDAEVFLSQNVWPARMPFPGEDELDNESDAWCDEAFETFVGTPYEDSRFYWAYWTPGPDSWARGNRHLTCVLYDPDRPLEHSVKDSGL